MPGHTIEEPDKLTQVSLANIGRYMLVDSCIQTLNRSTYFVNIVLTSKLVNYKTNLEGRKKRIPGRSQHQVGPQETIGGLAKKITIFLEHLKFVLQISHLAHQSMVHVNKRDIICEPISLG